MRTSRYSRFKNLVRPHLLSISVAGLFLILSIVLLLSRFNDTHIGTTIKLFSSNIIYSISSTVSSPVRLINEGIANIKSLGNLYEDLKKYKQDQIVDSASFQEMIALKLKIAQYENLLNISKETEYSFITTRIVADFSNKYFSTLLVNSGSKNGLYVDMPVTGPDGVIGRVIDINNKISRVLLITNVNSRVPVNISERAFQGILVGQGQKNPLIKYSKNLESIMIGDLVTTSGKGGVFPPYLLIGQVIGKKGTTLEVEIFEDINALTHVRLLNYKFGS